MLIMHSLNTNCCSETFFVYWFEHRYRWQCLYNFLNKLAPPKSNNKLSNDSILREKATQNQHYIHVTGTLLYH